MNKLRKILENPPLKEVDCPNCSGSGMINLRGMVSSDDCPNCRSGYYGSSGKIEVQDFDETERLVREWAVGIAKSTKINA